MKNIFIKTTIVFFACAAFINAAENPYFDITTYGEISSKGQTFQNLYDYFNSEHFVQNGKRCLVKTLDPKYRSNAIEKKSDCNLYQTVIKDEYWPTVTYIIPVVVHNIIKTDSTGLLSDERIQAQIDVLNEDFGAITGTLGELGFDTKIQFNLVEITRTVNDDWFNDNDEYGFKTSLNRDPNTFLNIYTNSASGYLGYSYMPQDAVDSVFDGVVVLYEAFGGRGEGFPPYNQGRTLTHEVGHYLGLLHTFEGYSCYTGYNAGDLLEDTFPQKDESYGCFETRSCDSPDNIQNYMNYTDDLCMTEFTAEQANRMICALYSYRASLAEEGNYEPQITSTPDTIVTAGERFEYLVEATDVENDAITYTLLTGPEGMELDSLSGEIVWVPGQLDIGRHSISIKASDDTGSDIQNFTLLVIPSDNSVIVDFAADSTVGNVPMTVRFFDQTLGEVTSWYWDFGDSSVSTLPNPEHIYDHIGEYSVKLKVEGTFGVDSLIKENYITVLPPKPVADFEAEPLEGRKPMHVRFSDLSKGDIESWFWDFGDSSFSILQNPIHVYTQPGIYSVGLAVKGPGGSDTLTVKDYIEIKDTRIKAVFNAEPRIGAAPLTVQFSDSSLGDIAVWYWDFGDSTTSTDQHPEHIYKHIGTYTVTLIAIGNTEIDTLVLEDFIRVTEDPPSANFSADPLIGPYPLTVQFTDSSLGLAESWLWSFGDSTLSRKHNPVHTFIVPGFYTISQIVNGPGGADTLTKIDYIQVLEPAPVAWFGVQETTGLVPFAVQFSDSSTGNITSWVWDFGDSTGSDEQNPVHEYQHVGEYSVTLTVSGPGGEHSAYREQYISVQFPLGVDDNEKIPTEFKLYQNYPNPFNAGTTISYQLPKAESVWLGIYDMSGKLVRVLERGRRDAGNYHVLWDGVDGYGMVVSSGLYMVQIHAGAYREHIKMLLLK